MTYTFNKDKSIQHWINDYGKTLEEIESDKDFIEPINRCHGREVFGMDKHIKDLGCMLDPITGDTYVVHRNECDIEEDED